MSDTYISGTCNLGKAEVRRRQLVAVAGAIFSLISLIGLIQVNASPSARWSIFVPLFVFSIGFIQSRRKFCLAYGFLGTFNLGKLGDISRVQDREDRKRDRKTALSILFQSALLALILSAIVVALPL